MTKRQPLYKQIYQQLLADIQAGKYPPGSQLPTEAELAEAHNVSRITSKRALSQLAEEGLIDRIRGRGSFVVASERLRSQKPDTIVQKRIGFIAQDLGITYGMELLAGVEQESRRHRLSLLLRLTEGSQELEIAAIEEMMAHRPSGLIVFPVNGERYNPALLKLYLAGLPIVLVDRYFRGLDVASVGSDNEAAASEAVSYLIELGHRNIALLSPPPEDTVTIEDRIKGYVTAFTHHNLSIDHSLFLTDLTTALPGTPQTDAYEQDRQKIAELLSNHPEVSALFAVEYNLAEAARTVAEQMGLAIPEDLSIVCFDALSYNQRSDAFFTHIRQNEREMGRKAIQLLVDLMSRDDAESARREGARSLVPTQLVKGASTARPKAHRANTG